MRFFQCAAAAVLIAACSNGSDPADEACPQTIEFGNIGCARVEGVVRYADGTPVVGARVSLMAADGSTSFDTPLDDSDAKGAFSLEIHDYGFDGRHEPRPDPVAMNLRAQLLGGTPENPAPASDLVPVNLKFSALGEVPEVTSQNISIDVTP